MTYISEVKEEDHREESIAVNIKCVHRFDLVTALRSVKLFTVFITSQILVGDESSDGCHDNSCKDEM